MVRQFRDGVMVRVTDNGTISEAFAVTNGVKRDCVLAPTLFSHMFSAMLRDACCYGQPETNIAYTTRGHLLNSRRMKASTRAFTTTANDLLLADCALCTATEEGKQRTSSPSAA
nr:unnamed protein product [Spirometra erinaceieuropaei]